MARLGLKNITQKYGYIDKTRQAAHSNPLSSSMNCLTPQVTPPLYLFRMLKSLAACYIIRNEQTVFKFRFPGKRPICRYIICLYCVDNLILRS